MIFNLIIGIFLGYEIQKLIQFKEFFKLRRIISDYYDVIILKQHFILLRKIFKISTIDIIYFIIIFIGIFTINKYLFFAIFVQSIITATIFKLTKNKFFRKITSIIDSIISILILILILINSLFYNIESLQFIKMIINNL